MKTILLNQVPLRKGRKNSSRPLSTWKRFAKSSREVVLGGLCPVRSLADLYPGHIRRSPHRPPPPLHAPYLETLQMLPSYSYLSRTWVPAPDAYATIVDDVLYFPKYGLLVSAAEHAVIAESLNSLHHRFRNPLEVFPRKPISIDGTAAPLRGVSKGFAHTLRDDLPRVTLLGAGDLRDIPIKLLFVPPLYDVERFHLEQLLPTNVTLLPIDIDRVYRLQNAAVATFLTGFPKVYYLPKWYTDMLHVALTLRETKKERKIYVARGDVHRRRVLNEDELVATLEREGFEVFDPGAHPIETQVSTFASAHVVVGAHSAALGNMMFAKDASLIELFPSQWAHPNFYLLGLPLGQHYRCQYSGSYEGGPDDDFVVDTDALRRELESVLET